MRRGVKEEGQTDRKEMKREMGTKDGDNTKGRGKEGRKKGLFRSLFCSFFSIWKERRKILKIWKSDMSADALKRGAMAGRGKKEGNNAISGPLIYRRPALLLFAARLAVG